MCCFSRPVRFVGGTRIFARGLSNGRQALVYAMNVELDEELAMILPLPVPPGAADDAVRFLDLEGYEAFFDDLSKAFPALAAGAQPLARGFGPVAQAPKLAVHEVGRYEASFVPSPADFGRLDPRFRLPDGFLQALPRYADWGFAVFRLKPSKSWLGGRKRQSVHPMAFTFPRREPRSLFFPTVHVHDGSVPATATFDHALYCQADGVLGATLGWPASHATLGKYVPALRCGGVIDEARGGFATALYGSLKNADLWLREPDGVELDSLRGGGECHAFEIQATAAHAFGWEGLDREPWQRTAQARLPALCRGVRAGLAELEGARRQAWRLAPLSDALPPHFMNGPKLWTGTSYLDGAPARPGVPGRVRFTPFTKLVEPQAITLGFAALPDQEGAAAINAELARLLDRAVS